MNSCVKKPNHRFHLMDFEGKTSSFDFSSDEVTAMFYNSSDSTLCVLRVGYRKPNVLRVAKPVADFIRMLWSGNAIPAEIMDEIEALERSRNLYIHTSIMSDNLISVDRRVFIYLREYEIVR